MSKPFVSIIMPTYNTPYEYLSESVQSMLNQTYKQFELIIIDDASTDYNAPSVIKKIVDKDDRIKLISNQHSKGVAGALNTGIDYAQGKYIIRMDSDDISLNTRLEEQINYMERHPEISILATYAKEFGMSERILRSEKENISIKTAFIFQSGLVHPTICIRSDVLSKYNLRYSEGVKNEDYDLWTRCSIIEDIKFATIPKVLLKYRTHQKQVTKTKHSEIFQNGIDLRKNYVLSITDNSDIYKLDLFVDFALLRLKHLAVLDILKAEKSILDNSHYQLSKKVFWFNSLKKSVRYLLRGKISSFYLLLYSLIKMYI